MNQSNRSLDTAKFVKWVVIITIVAAAIEIPIIYFYFSNKTPVAKASVLKRKQQPASTSQPINNPGSESPIQIQTQAIVVAPEPLASIVDTQVVRVKLKPGNHVNEITDSGKKPKLMASAPKRIISKEPKAASAVKEPSSKPNKIQTLPQQLTEAMMQNIIAQLNAKNEQRQQPLKCVKIRQTFNSNVTNAFKIADHLRASGFSISGRETVTQTVKGVAVTNSISCLVVTIGSL